MAVVIPEAITKLGAVEQKENSEQVVVGNTIRVHMKVQEGGKERVQVFAGLVIARDGQGATETFTVRRISHGVGAERVFPVHSPRIVKIETERSGRTRRAKLYYLRDRVGKKARLREVVRGRHR